MLCFRAGTQLDAALTLQRNGWHPQQPESCHEILGSLGLPPDPWCCAVHIRVTCRYEGSQISREKLFYSSPTSFNWPLLLNLTSADGMPCAGGLGNQSALLLQNTASGSTVPPGCTVHMVQPNTKHPPVTLGGQPVPCEKAPLKCG